MLERLIFAGFGGQGIIFIGKLFAGMALQKAENITFIPSYGAEVRGGTSNCQIILSSAQIASPIVEQAETMILLNQLSVDRFLPDLTKGGTAYINTSMAKAPDDSRVVGIPATNLAREAGNVLAANIVVLSAYLHHSRLFDYEDVAARVAAVSEQKGKQAVKVNAAALDKGWHFAPAG